MREIWAGRWPTRGRDQRVRFAGPGAGTWVVIVVSKFEQREEGGWERGGKGEGGKRG